MKQKFSIYCQGKKTQKQNFSTARTFYDKKQNFKKQGMD